MNDTTAAHKDKLMADLRLVISDAEELLRLGAEQTGASATEWRAKVEERISRAKLIGAAAGVGLIVGLLIGLR